MIAIDSKESNQRRFFAIPVNQFSQLLKMMKILHVFDSDSLQNLPK